MKCKKIDLHMDKKRALVLMLFFALAYFCVFLFAVLSIDKESAQLSSLLRSDYEYSAVSAKPILRDDYYRLNAGIGFSTTSDSKTGINAEVLMQSKDSQYTSSVEWNADKLTPSSVAITKGIAKANNLQVGNSIYSKHVVDGTVHEYTIEEILPEVSASKYSEKGAFTAGIIIMGYDQAYIDNITHTTLLYTKEPINEISLRLSETPLDLLYRSDEIAFCFRIALPYWILFILIAILITVLLVILLTRMVSHNYKRLMTLGFDDKELNKSFYRMIFGESITSILMAFFLLIVISNLFIFSSVGLAFLLTILLVEFATLLISASVSKRKLWR